MARTVTLNNLTSSKSAAINIEMLASALRTIPANAVRRATAMKLFPECDRCRGCGRYSFNGSHSICYGCTGSGQRPPKSEREWMDVIGSACDAAADGRLDQYLAFLAALKITKNATDQMMAAWTGTGISPLYDWRKAAAHVRDPKPETQRDHDLSLINQRMADAYTTVQTAANALDARKPTYQADVLALATLLEQQLAVIADAKADLEKYLEQGA